MLSLFVGGLLWLPLTKCMKDREALLALTIAQAHKEADYLLTRMKVDEIFRGNVIDENI